MKAREVRRVRQRRDFTDAARRAYALRAATSPAPMPTCTPPALAAMRSCRVPASARAPARRCRSSTSSSPARPMVAHTLAALAGVRAARAGAGRARARTTTQFERHVAWPSARASRSRAAAARRARRTVAARPRRAARSAARAPTTGCWCTTRRAAWCAPNGSTRLIDACRDDAGRRPARAAGGRHAEARDATAASRRRSTARRHVAGADAADVPPRPAAPTRSTRRRRERHRRGERDRGARAARRKLVPGRCRELQGHQPGGLRRCAEALLAQAPTGAGMKPRGPTLAHRRRLGHARAGRRAASSILGGVEIPHTHGLLGHSDADALLPRDHRRAVRRRRAGRHRPPLSRHRRAVPAAPTRWRCWPRRRAACEAAGWQIGNVDAHHRRAGAEDGAAHRGDARSASPARSASRSIRSASRRRRPRRWGRWARAGRSRRARCAC